MGTIVQFDQVTYTYPGAEKPAIQDISLSIHEGELILITGPSGAGKTTLCSTLNRIVPESYAGNFQGKLLVYGKDISKRRIGDMAFIAGLLFQDPSGQLTNPTVEDEIAFGPENRGLPVKEVERLIKEYSGYVGMEAYLQRPPQALSGGQQQSVALASVLAMEPEIYVLDEPTSNLDPLGSDLVFQLMKKLAEDKKKTVLIVEHKLEKVIDLVNRIIVMDKGHIVYDDTPDEVLRHSRELRKIGVITPQINQFCSWLNEEKKQNLTQPRNLDQAVNIFKKLLPQVPPREQLLHEGEKLKRYRKFTEPIIHVEDLRFGYTPNVEVLHGINLDIYKGQFVSIVGHNGSGKTTIVKHFNGLHQPLSGRVLIKGQDTKQTTVAELSKSVGYCFQNPDHQIFSSIVADELAYGPRNLSWSKEDINRTVHETARLLGIENLLDANPYNLSKGQRQQIAVAAILCMKPDILIVDEPTTGQDPVQSRAMMDMMKFLNEEMGKTIVVITHDMGIAAEYSDRIVAMHMGCIIADGTPREVFAEEEVLRSSNLEAPQITRLFQYCGLSSPTVVDVDEACRLLGNISL
ncbi:ABC transporter ATP-binding protein [Pyramidobacter piscolens]|uniref:ABC transporter ATP-binding protein n=1 Tax=Pyramidobacter piscolens TaxID=638849 RepID=UPI002AB194C4|nr:energy-coupling factor transporter ATPase [Pyramidobacter piscolens]